MSSEQPKRGRGRPPLPPGESRARETELRVRASHAEIERWTVAAGGRGELAGWVRDRLDEAAAVETREQRRQRRGEG